MNHHYILVFENFTMILPATQIGGPQRCNINLFGFFTIAPQQHCEKALGILDKEQQVINVIVRK